MEIATETTVTIDEIQSTETRHTSGVYSKRPITIVRGQGATLWDSQGNQYIDCVGGHGSANLGHSHPAVVEAIKNQADKLIVCPELFFNDQRSKLESLLCQVSGMGRVFLCNSGTEAVEAALKFARLLAGRTKIIATMRGFHGRSMGALSATWEKKFREPYEPLVPDFHHAPYNDLDKLAAVVDENTAAVILEVVQGEGGVRPATEEYLLGAQSLCRETGALLIIDEVQTGFGRTGKLFAFQHFGLDPDILCLAKSIAGGVPMGAALLNKRFEALPSQVHGSTFGGNPLACAASLAAIEALISGDLPARALELGDEFRQKLSEIQSPLIREVRGMGLMVGVELKQKVTPYLQELMKRGVLALPAGLNVMRFLPPLVISRQELDIVVNTVKDVLTSPLGEE